MVSPAIAKETADSLIWQISKKGQPNSYLIGTLHLGKKGSTLPKAFQAALNNSAVLVLETRSSPEYIAQNPYEAMQMFTHFTHKKSLRQTLGIQRLQAIRRIYAKSSLPELNLIFTPEAQIAPWVVWFYFSYDLVPDHYDLDNGIDMQLERQAEKTGKHIIGLEHDEALIMLKKIPDDVAIRAIDAVLANPQKLGAQNAQMFRFYEQGRLQDLWQWVKQSNSLSYGLSAADAKLIDHLFYEQLLKQRNQNWLSKIITMLPTNSHTIAVGAAHLAGENGLIALLRQQGYQVVPIKMN